MTTLTKRNVHANDLFREDGALKCLGLHRSGKAFRWDLHLPNRVRKTLLFDQVYARRQVDDMTMRIGLAYGIPENSITNLIIKHAITALVKNRHKSGYKAKQKGEVCRT